MKPSYEELEKAYKLSCEHIANICQLISQLENDGKPSMASKDYWEFYFINKVQV